MADQSQTATNNQSEPTLCKQGCGFFGNAATGWCCSKCWRDIQKTKSAVAEAVVSPPSPEASTEASCEKVVEKVVPLSLVVDEPTADAKAASESSTKTPKSSATVDSENALTETPSATENVTAVVANAPAKKKKKKKKTSYKNMMASMMKETSRDPVDKDSAKDDAIRKVTGGGAFSKIEKI
eukprot:CAMPEP_0201135778 /NCGR_PEP_ID=MMETSP0850-20130426/54508_1 /ASSEMBLY_ACC=CAM_ASM_000622 /TAXON_ID=183588 /ORGANISM="Pseudo-nitzschia fraudulenta, Strain WWA7" /LENGTH=181 /DNA_ID=CAMNT_0047406989 /DNA_START=776 /DNA_END=1321 /DNA_ORIENTATION=+